jgi:hypothetical protein
MKTLFLLNSTQPRAKQRSLPPIRVRNPSNEPLPFSRAPPCSHRVEDTSRVEHHDRRGADGDRDGLVRGGLEEGGLVLRTREGKASEAEMRREARGAEVERKRSPRNHKLLATPTHPSHPHSLSPSHSTPACGMSS